MGGLGDEEDEEGIFFSGADSLNSSQVFMGDNVRAGLSSVRFAVSPNLTFDERMVRYQQALRHFEAALAAASQKPAPGEPAPLVPPPSVDDAKLLLTQLEWQVLAAKTLRPQAEAAVAEGDTGETPLLELSFFDSPASQQRLCIELLWQTDQV